MSKMNSEEKPGMRYAASQLIVNTAYNLIQSALVPPLEYRAQWGG